MTRISGVTRCSFAGLLLWAGVLLVIPASAQQTCTFTFSPASENFLASGGTGTFTVTASSSTCVRNATASASWITITFGNTGTGNGTVGYAVAANTAADQRTGTITIGNQTFTITQAGAPGQTCTFTLIPTSASFQASGGSGTISVTASNSSCVRDATASASWILISIGRTGTGSGTIGYTVAANNSPQSRTGTITAGNQTFTINQAGASCNYTLSPTSASVPAAGGSGAFNVTTSCTWMATADAPWITITSPANGSGAGAISYTVAPNPTGDSRTGNIRVGDQTFSIFQPGMACTFTLSSPSAAVSGNGETGSINVLTAPNCRWTAVTSFSWITISAGSSGMGNGTVQYAVAANSAEQSRSGTISAGGVVFTVTQAGGGCSYSLSAKTAVPSAGGGIGSVAVTTRAGCSWSAVSNVAWITVTSVASASGPGTVSYSVSANSTNADRTGTLTIAGQTLTVIQPSISTRVLITAVVNAASFLTGPVAAGELVTIYGLGLGPARLTTLQLTADGRFLTTSLAETRVLFDGSPAPLVYVSEGQVSAIVPYAVAGKTRTLVQVDYLGNRSSAFALDVAPAAPAIFSLAASGSGPGAILNQNFSVNSDANPATKGSIVMIFATGEGQTMPAGMDGKLTADVLPRPVLPVSVRIGGIDAEVLYAGGAPRLVAGVLQVNARIPVDVVPGSAIPVQITVGTVQSPAQVTVSVQ